MSFLSGALPPKKNPCFCSIKGLEVPLPPGRDTGSLQDYTWVGRGTKAVFTLGAQALVLRHQHRMVLCSDTKYPIWKCVHIQ